jgi:predicted metal-dependent peptidase
MEHASNLLSHIGKITDGQNRVLEILGLKRTIDWRIALQSTMQQFVPTDYTFSRRNRKVRTAYLPTLEKKSFEVFVAIDTSGSVDSKLISAYLTEIAGIAQTYPNINLTLLDCDCRVHSVQKLAPSQLKNVTLKGNGGTSHKALFDYISLNRLKPKVLICFTDACSDINQCVQPPYKVIWVVPNKTKLPFGHIITMEM